MQIQFMKPAALRGSFKLMLTGLALSLGLAACDRLPNNGVNTGAPPYGPGNTAGQPSAMPLPTGAPTSAPTMMPSMAPSMMPSMAPTMMPTAAPAEFVQVERLARPAVNEGLLLSNDLLNTWNMVPPTADLSPAAKPIADEATTVLKALGNTDADVAALFKALLPDVMRIDTTRKSGYVGSAPGLLDNVTKDLRPIGGRLIKDDVIDVTLALIVPGGAPGAAAIDGLESDHVSYDGPNANGTAHKPLLNEFPYLAGPNE